ncbi:MAG TPA: hypothetical protein VK524_15130 [Polyangiaceae bacterium]|nr:hypothetical protein [Polyangiaceae bacterium]
MSETANLRNVCRIVEGRLLEIDVAAGYNSTSDVTEMIAMIAGEFAKVPVRTRIVIAADWRPCRLFTPDVAERAVQMMSGVNPRIERSAILHRVDQATSVLQVARLIKEAQSPHRRVFTNPFEMESWLGEILSDAERARLRTFLDQRA